MSIEGKTVRCRSKTEKEPPVRLDLRMRNAGPGNPHRNEKRLTRSLPFFAPVLSHLFRDEIIPRKSREKGDQADHGEWYHKGGTSHERLCEKRVYRWTRIGRDQ